MSKWPVIVASASVCVAWLACGTGEPADPSHQGGSPSTPAGGDGGGADAGPQRAAHGLDRRPVNETCVAGKRPTDTTAVKLVPAYADLNLFQAMMLQQAPNDPSRMFVALRSGELVSFPKAGATATTVVANLSSLSGIALNQSGEGGFLAFAFHPKFSANGRVYVSWTTGDGPIGNNMRSRIGYITSSDGGQTFASYKDVLSLDQPGLGHYGGTIAFGPDGYLYASFGDGSVDMTNGQRTTGMFAKLIRIDVDAPPPGSAYGIPSTNPFASGGGEAATFAFGFRNPFRFSFDSLTGDLWAGDVGLGEWEEVDVVKRGGNYGWHCLEGTHPNAWASPPCPPEMLVGRVPPIYEYPHNGQMRCIIGGVVYRGTKITNLVGRYLFGDEITGEIWSLVRDAATGEVTTTRIHDGVAFNPNWVAFSEDLDHDVYAVGIQGKIYKFEQAENAPPVSSIPDRLSKTGCFDARDPRRPSTGQIPFGVNAELWSDRATKERSLAIPDGTAIDVGADGDFALPVGSVVSKTFAIKGKRIETRLLMRHDDGVWAGYSYEWLDDESDALLLPASKRKRVGDTDWSFPSRGDCMLCHTAAAGRTLGLEVGQLNGDFVYASTNRISNQLETLEHVGLFSSALGRRPSELEVIPSPFGDARLESRARAYLHANCSHCHRPDGGGRAAVDLRFSTALPNAKACDVAPEAGDLGIAGAKLFAPSDPARSLISVRAHRTDAARMPPLASALVDEAGLAVVDAWINATPTCP